jgi:hypothetical protein
MPADSLRRKSAQKAHGGSNGRKQIYLFIYSDKEGIEGGKEVATQ